MKVLYITHRYVPETGGVETHVATLARALAAAGDDVTVATVSPSRAFVGERQEDGIRVLRYAATVPGQHFRSSLDLSRRLSVDVGAVDVVHAHNYHALAALAGLRVDAPLVVTSHYHGGSQSPVRDMLHRVYRPVGRRLLTSATRLIAVSEAERRRVAEHFPSVADRLSVVPNGARPAAAARDRQPGEVVVIGRLEHYKRVDTIIDAIGLMPTARLTVVGQGAARASLEARARTVAPARIRFTGRIELELLDRILAQAAVLAAASEHEAFGLTAADALATGVPVVASAIDAHRDLMALAGVGAPMSLVTGHEPAAWAAALQAALATGWTTPVDLPSWADVVGRTRDVYVQAIAGAAKQVTR